MESNRDPQACKILLWCLKSRLSYKQTEVTMFKFVNKLPQERVGKLLSPRVSRQRVSQIEITALAKIKRMLIKNNYTL